MNRNLPLIMALAASLISCIYQRADMTAEMSVNAPVFAPNQSPQVRFDEAHGNFHSLQTTYEPFATLLRNDGIEIDAFSATYTPQTLENIDLLIIANATAPENHASAFSKAEIRTLLEWVAEGGSLLLIADHEPFGSASAELARAFEVGMTNVWTVDPQRNDPSLGRNSWLVFNRENGGLGTHPILNPPGGPPDIRNVITFTGQSLSYDSTWTPLLHLSDSARNYYDREQAANGSSDPNSYFSAAGEAQLIAKSFGRGRIVIAGEAAMFTAQEVRIFFKVIHAGFNFNGYDNKQLILNIMHWLLFRLDPPMSMESRNFKPET